MQIELLKDIVLYIAGSHAVDIVDSLYGKENVNEFLIAKKLDVTINQARNILYKLGDEGLVRFIRKKDKKNGGWYTYFWTLDVMKALLILRKRLMHEIEQLEHQLTSRKTKRFYYSPSADIEYSEESALEHNFICPETGEVMELKDNTGFIEETEGTVVALRERLGHVDAEIAVLEKKAAAARERKRKAEEKKKKEEREARRKARELEKKKEAKKQGKVAGKKTAKKTTKKKTTSKKTTKKGAAKKTRAKTKSATKKKTTKKKSAVKKPAKKTTKKKVAVRKKPATKKTKKAAVKKKTAAKKTRTPKKK